MRVVRQLRYLGVVVLALVCALLTVGSASASKSSSFAGYMAAAPSGQFLQFKYITATFTVPSLNCSATPNSQVYQWAALGGYRDSYLQASGVYEECSGGTASYEGVIASADGTIASKSTSFVLAVNPGDEVSASVHSTPSSDTTTYTLTDRSTGKYYQHTFNMGFQEPTTAEVISNGNVSSDGTADFGNVNFFNIKVTDTNMPASRGMVYSAWDTLKFHEWGIVTGKTDIESGGITTTTSKPFESAFTNSWVRTDQR